jgi:hypothetical protein
MSRRKVFLKVTVFSEIRGASIISALSRVMEAISITETSVNFYETTRRNNPYY